MSDQPSSGFGRFVPGFDFLQNLAKGAGQTIPQLPNLSNWVAPTLNVEELEKRIDDLKAVHFWLDQNGKALAATIQALEVQKMTLATLQGMNFNMGDVANALKLKATDSVLEGMQKVTESAATAAGTVAGVAGAVRHNAQAGKPKKAAKGASAAPETAPIDPLHWWGALTQQFQEIATNALKDATQKTAADAAKHMATGVAKDTAKAARSRGKAAAPAPAPARKAAAKAARKAPARKSRGT